MDPDSVEKILAEQSASGALRNLQAIYVSLAAGVVMLFGFGTFLGLHSTGEEVDGAAAAIAYIGMGAPVLIYIVSNQVFTQMIRNIDSEGDVFVAVRTALILKAAIIEGSALIGGVAWILICSQTNLAHIPQVYFGVFLGLLVMVLNTVSYFPTLERVRWWLLS